MTPPPQSKWLPRQVDPRKLVAQGAVLAGDVPASALNRLGDTVSLAGENAAANLSFIKDEEGRGIVQGEIHLRVRMQCQRCLKPVGRELNCNTRLAIVWDEEQAEKLPSSLDPWIVPEAAADLFDLVEDELLLALPIVAYHDEAECDQPGHFSTGDFEETPEENPFQVLAQLKNKQ